MGRNTKWSYDACKQVAEKYRTAEEFYTKDSRAYKAASKNKWLKDYSWLLKGKQAKEAAKKVKKPVGYWKEYTNCFNEALKYTSRGEFAKKSNGAYMSALNNNYIDSFDWLGGKTKKNGEPRKKIEYDYDYCKKLASMCGSKAEYTTNYRHAAMISRKNGWINEFFGNKAENYNKVHHYKVYLKIPKNVNKRNLYVVYSPKNLNYGHMYFSTKDYYNDKSIVMSHFIRNLKNKIKYSDLSTCSLSYFEKKYNK